MENLMPVNYVMLCVIAGIIGLVVGAFTIWHIMLAGRGQTTIECLEKTRYLSPLRKSMQDGFIAQHTPGGVHLPRYGQQLLDIHANALPGITRPEEGEEYRDGARPVHANYSDRERHQSRKRYEAYLDEQDSQKLPNAFNLGWKRNFRHLLGPNPWLWFLPICNTTGDGWAWEPSPKWLEARDQVRAEREEQRAREVEAGWGGEETPTFVRSPNTDGAARHYSPSPVPSSGGYGAPPPGGGRRTPSKADRVLGRDPNMYADEALESVSMRRLSPRGRTLEEELLDDDNDLMEDLQAGSHTTRESRPLSLVPTGGWSGGASGVLRKGSPTTPKLVVEHVGRDGDDGLD